MSACGNDGESAQDAQVNSAELSAEAGPHGRVRLQVVSRTISEGDDAMVEVVRADGDAGPISIVVVTRDGSAQETSDYEGLNQIVRFADRDSQTKRLAIAVADDATDEPGETFVVSLSSPTGGAVLSAEYEALLTIADNDPSSPGIPRAAISANQGNLRIDWSAVPEAATYRVLKSDGSRDPWQLGSDLPPTTKHFEFRPNIHKENWSALSYFIEACNSTGCSRSEALPAKDLSARLIGYLKSPEPFAFQNFGSAVALSGDGNTLVVGVRDSFAVYIYSRAGQGWSAPTVLASPSPQLLGFGEVLALSEDGGTLAVGVPSDDTVALNSGAVHVYLRSTFGSWTSIAMLKAPNPGSGDDFGSAVALSSTGEVLAVGAKDEDSDARNIGGVQNENAQDSGAVYVFRRSGMTWSGATYVKSPQTRLAGWFGTTVALSGDGSVLAVGESAAACSIVYPGPACIDVTGAVHVYDTENWGEAAVTLKPPYSTVDDRFGASVGISHDGAALIVGAPGEDGAGRGDPRTDCEAFEPSNCELSSGAAFLFSKNRGTWSEPTYLKATSVGQGDSFGNTVALSADGTTLAVAATRESGSAVGIDSEPDELLYAAGSVYVAAQSSGAWSPLVYVKASNTERYEEFGQAIALSGDGNMLAVTSTAEDSAAANFNGGSQVDDCEREERSQANCAIFSGAVYIY
jgi:trimeric autotransporter adhesin